MRLIGIIPLGGNATRMKHLPKFLLPCDIGSNLLDHTIEIFNINGINNIIAGVSSSNNNVLQNYTNLTKLIVDTKTMAETVYKMISCIQQEEDKFILIMPDTYFTINKEISVMKTMLDTYDIVVLCWNIKDHQIGKVGQCNIVDGEVVDVVDKNPSCTYPYFWGVIGWNSKLNSYISREWETIGDLIKISIKMNIKVGAIIVPSNYYDCGTYSEYFMFIKNN